MRRATPPRVATLFRRCYFYPRSPCGERHTWARGSRVTYVISIHALLAESDPPRVLRQPTATGFLSTLSLRRATKLRNPSRPGKINFYPRSPCGERLDELCRMMGIKHFYPRSPCGERHTSGATYRILRAFLSTLSLRRATASHTNLPGWN